MGTKRKTGPSMALSSNQKKRLRNLLLRRHSDCCFCGLCFETTTNVKITIEHIIPLGVGGSDEHNNLTLSCLECNNDRGCIDFHVYRESKKDERLENYRRKYGRSHVARWEKMWGAHFTVPGGIDLSPEPDD